jgi:peptidoglycan DL-endopeptidase CwlO
LNKKKILSVMLALGLVMNLSSTVLADPIRDLERQREAQQRQLREDTNQLQAVENRLDELESHIQYLSFQIQTIREEIKANEEAIKKSMIDIKRAEAEVDKAQKDIEEQEELLAKRMRAIYMSGSQGYLALILKSKGISDLVSRIESVNKIIQFDKKAVAELEERKLVLEEKKAELDKENEKLLAIKAKNNQKLAELDESRKKQLALRSELKKQEVLFASKVQERRAAIAAAEAEIKRLRDATPKYVPSRGAASATQQNIVVYASNFLGTPYVWGGTTPNPGFDCSGFVQYVYRHFGINLTRTTFTQVNEGVFVPRDQLQLGDLVFFRKPGGSVHHVGIYVGNNCYIHAPQTGDVIRIQPLTRPDYYTARRILR